MRYSRPCLKVEKFTVSDAILADEMSAYSEGGGFTPYDEDNGTGGGSGSGGPGFETLADALDILFND